MEAEIKSKSVTLLLHRLPPSLNQYIRLHWRKRKDIQKTFDNLVWFEWLRLDRFVFKTPVKLTFLLYFPDKRQRDKDNYIGGTKPVIDALKRTFIFRDDSEWVKDIAVRFLEGPERTVIAIDEAA